MISCALTATVLLSSQSNTPVIEPSSFYGVKTFATNPQFRIMADRFVLAFAPEDTSTLTMHLLKDDQEVRKDNFYEDPSNYPAFKLLRPTGLPYLEIPEPGNYNLQIRNNNEPITIFPFKLAKKSTGDEFNPTVFWDYQTPFDKMGQLSFSNSENSDIFFYAWFAPQREGYFNQTTEVTFTHNGKVLATNTFKFQEPQNARQLFKLVSPKGFNPFRKDNLLALNGDFIATAKVNGKVIRKFTWKIASGKITPHPNTASTFSPRTNYYVPRTISTIKEGYQNRHLFETYWSSSN